MNESAFLHMVYFYARPDGTMEDATRTMEGCRRLLSGIPGVLRLEVGIPAGTKRDVVDNSYLVALLVEFADADAQDAYQVHPDHLTFVKEYSPLWSRVQVFDTILLKN